MANQVTKMYDENGVLRHTMLSTFSQRRDGSWVDDRLSYDGKSTPGTRVVVDVTTAALVALDLSTNAKTTYNLGADEVAAAAQGPDPGCSYLMRDTAFLKVQQQLAERTTFLDRPAIKTVASGASPGGAIVEDEKFIVPSLNCAVVKESFTRKDSPSERGSLTVTEFVSVKETSPDPTLFVIDPNLTEMSPAEAIRKKDQARGKQCRSCELARGQLDKAYESHQIH